MTRAGRIPGAPARQPATAESVREMECRLIRRENGGWLAVSVDDAPIGIGVEAWSVDDARYRFRRAAREWAELFEAHNLNPDGAPR